VSTANHQPPTTSRIAPLQAIVDVDAAARAGWPPADLARAFLDGGATWIQVRAKQLSSSAFLELCDAVVRSAETYHATVIVNDRADLAMLSGASGVHVGQDDLPPSAVRRLLGPSAVVGYSTHTTDQFDAGLREPVSYLAVGPVFGTTSKDTGYTAVGLDRVSAAAARANGRPIVAIGGITLETAASVIEAGATAVAVIGDLLVAGDPRGTTRAYLQKLAQFRV
jgi:thiamine-phosphate pyrophosphorylase